MASSVSCIENSEKNTLLAFLARKNNQLVGIDWASAFITRKGIQKILHAVERLAKGKRKIRILVGLYQWFTEPSALKELLDAKQRLRDKLEVRISRTQRFHWKFYLLRENVRSTIVIGSSNLTSDGLASEGELNAVIRCNSESSELLQFTRVFNEQWSEAAALSSELISKYSAQRGELEIPQPANVRLDQILGKSTHAGESILATAEGRRYFRRSLSGRFSSKTDSILSASVEDSDKYDWLINSENHGLGDRGIVFDFDDRRITAIEIVKTTTLPVNTPEGRRFAAYKPIAKIPKPEMTPSRRALLRELGLITSWKDADRIRSLKEVKFDEFVAALRTKA